MPACGAPCVTENDRMSGSPENMWRAALRRNPEHARQYAERWRRLEAEGRDIHGEARLLDAMADRRSRILDAGCGQGRVGGQLAACGHRVVGVDLDPTLIEVARSEQPGARWEVQDLAALDLRGEAGQALRFDLIVAAGNVPAFLAVGERAPTLERLRAHLDADGRMVMGFSTDRGWSAEEFEADAAAAGWRLQQRWSSWQLYPYAGGFLVAVLVPAG